MRTGFIGLGNIGAPMAHRVAAASDCAVRDISPAAMAGFSEVARLAATPADVGRHAEIVGICVRDGDQVRATIAGPAGLLEGLASEAIILIHSTVAPALVHEMAELAAPHGVHVLDAGVTGGAAVASRGELCTMVGGDADLVERARPMLASFSSRIIHAGSLGAGLALKICNNLITYLQVAAFHEAIELAAAYGVDQETLTEVMIQNGNLTPALRMYGKSLANRQADNQPLHAAALAEKDLDLVVDLGRAASVPTPVSAHARGLMRRAFAG